MAASLWSLVGAVILRVIFIPEWLRLQPRWLVLLEGLILVGLIGWLDHATGWEWSFFALFALPIALVAWKLGWRGVGLTRFDGPFGGDALQRKRA